MEFFTAFYIEYTLRDMEVQSYLILPSYAACQVAIRAEKTINDMFDPNMSDAKNLNLYCVETDKLSKSIRPKLPPSN